MMGYKAQFWNGRKKDSYRCPDCGRTREQAGQIDVHHVDRNHSNDDHNNLQGTCRRCHLKQKHGRRSESVQSPFEPDRPRGTRPSSGGSHGPKQQFSKTPHGGN